MQLLYVNYICISLKPIINAYHTLIAIIDCLLFFQLEWLKHHS
ncbi:hypothetical protein SS17_3326 [Escherichia coli O157:H7 str. SS17]|nr:hypothetical protein SS17_3326 [Escherichia coli O157:H7 str. SS17]